MNTCKGILEHQRNALKEGYHGKPQYKYLEITRDKHECSDSAM